MHRKTVVITGATSGIGLEAAKELARQGATVVLVGRTNEMAEAARVQVREASGSGALHTVAGDLGVQTDVRRVVREVLVITDRIDVLANNAGVYMPRFHETDDGIETTFAVNHLAYHLMTMGFLDRLKETAADHGEARVVSTASAAHWSAVTDLDDPEMRRRYRGWTQYCNTKLMNILWTKRLARELEGSGVTANCFHPGLVSTGLARRMPPLAPALKLLGTSAKKGADTLVWLATSEEVAAASGGYYARRRASTTSAAARDDQTADRLWTLTDEYVE